MKKYIYLLLICYFAVACKEDVIDLYNAERPALNFAKGDFNPGTYPESYSFNAYFLGVGAGDFTLQIPVRLSGTIDNENDRTYHVQANEGKSENSENGIHYTLAGNQIFRKGLYQDSVSVTIHVGALDTEHDYRIWLELVPGETFDAGIPEYQYVIIDFMKNLNTMPDFWANNSKLAKIPYHPKKCEVFLEISGITDPEWVDAGGTIQLEYWINLCTQYFLENDIYDEETGNRIYFDL